MIKVSRLGVAIILVVMTFGALALDVVLRRRIRSVEDDIKCRIECLETNRAVVKRLREYDACAAWLLRRDNTRFGIPASAPAPTSRKSAILTSPNGPNVIQDCVAWDSLPLAAAADVLRAVSSVRNIRWRTVAMQFEVAPDGGNATLALTFETVGDADGSTED